MKTEGSVPSPSLKPTDAEALRLQALRSSNLLDTPPEISFDRITRFAAKILRAPVTLVSLVDSDRQFFKSQCGLKEPVASARETPLSHSFCKHVVDSGEPLVVSDARLHPVLHCNPAIKDLQVVAYAGVPLLDSKGFVLGSFCAIDHQPRDWTHDELEILRGLASQVMTEIELRQTLLQANDDIRAVREREVGRERMTRFTVHDMRTPLCSLMLGIEMLPVLGTLSSSQSECLELCMRSAEMLRSVVDSLLDIDAIKREGAGALTLQTCNPAVLAASAIEQVIRLAQDRSITLKRDFSPGLLNFPGDEKKLVRVLVNLLGNAIKYTKPGGTVELSVRVEIDPTKKVLFIVNDSGIGMKEADTPQIFDEGVRLDKTAPTSTATGLGLTFCKQVVAAHQGTISVRSAPGQGSTFTVALPVEPCGQIRGTIVR